LILNTSATAAAGLYQEYPPPDPFERASDFNEKEWLVLKVKTSKNNKEHYIHGAIPNSGSPYNETNFLET